MPQGWDMGLEVRGEGIEEEKEEEMEKIPLCESIGHRPLRGRCPKRRSVLRREALGLMNNFPFSP